MMILSNQVHCNHCGAEPFSAFRHDFVACDCEDVHKRICVDGGMSYIRRVPGSQADYRDMSIVLPMSLVKDLEVAIEDEEKNTLGKVCNAVRVLRDAGINLKVPEEES